MVAKQIMLSLSRLAVICQFTGEDAGLKAPICTS